MFRSFQTFQIDYLGGSRGPTSNGRAGTESNTKVSDISRASPDYLIDSSLWHQNTQRYWTPEEHERFLEALERSVWFIGMEFTAGI